MAAGKAAGPCCWPLPSARFNGLGARAPLCLETRRRVLACLLPGSVLGRGLRDAGGRAGAAGCGAGAPPRPGGVGGADGRTDGRRRAAHCDPPAAGSARLLSAPAARHPGRPRRKWRTPRPTRACAAPGALRTLGVRPSVWKPGRAAGPGGRGLGSGRPLRPSAREKSEFRRKGSKVTRGQAAGGRDACLPSPWEGGILLFCLLFKSSSTRFFLFPLRRGHALLWRLPSETGRILEWRNL